MGRSKITGGYMKKSDFLEKLMGGVFFVAACASILSVVLICVFLLINGIPAIKTVGLSDFLLGKVWKPGNDIYGIFPMIVGSIYVTAGAIVVGVPIGVLTAVFMARFCPEWLHKILKPAFNMMAGIPSVVYGFFGLVVMVPMVRDIFSVPGRRINGNSMLTAALLLGIMILPTIISVSESALKAVPNKYYEGSLALGATHERSVFLVVIPAAKSGILAGVILGVGRAIGETMAVIMVAGNQPRVPENIFKGVRTMTANIVIEMGYAADLHREVLIATGIVLFVFILIINLAFSAIKRKAGE